MAANTDTRTAPRFVIHIQVPGQVTLEDRETGTSQTFFEADHGSNHDTHLAVIAAMQALTTRPCPQCGNPTIPADPARSEEHGDYCETCGRPYDENGRPLL